MRRGSVLTALSDSILIAHSSRQQRHNLCQRSLFVYACVGNKLLLGVLLHFIKHTYLLLGYHPSSCHTVLIMTGIYLGRRNFEYPGAYLNNKNAKFMIK